MANIVNIVTNPGLRHIRNQIFGYVSQKTLDICSDVSEDFNSWLERFCAIEFLLAFEDKMIKVDHWSPRKNALVKTIIPGWKKGVEKFAQMVCLDDLLELKEFISLYDKKHWLYETPVHFAARLNKPQAMQLFLYTDFKFNCCSNYSFFCFEPPFAVACSLGSVEVVKMMIKSSKKSGIDLYARDSNGTALDKVNFEIKFGDPKKRKVFEELKTLLEEEYSKKVQF